MNTEETCNRSSFFGGGRWSSTLNLRQPPKYTNTSYRARLVHFRGIALLCGLLMPLEKPGACANWREKPANAAAQHSALEQAQAEKSEKSKVMIHQGNAIVESQGVYIAECGPGEFLGEAKAFWGGTGGRVSGKSFGEPKVWRGFLRWVEGKQQIGRTLFFLGGGNLTSV